MCQIKQLKPKTRDKGSSPIIPVIYDSSKDVKIITKESPESSNSKSIHSSSISSLITDTLDDCEEYLPSEETSKQQVRFRESEKKRLSLQVKIMHVIDNLRLYMGMTPEALCIIDLLVNETKISKENICLVFTKIRLNDTFEKLGIEFEMSSSNASKIFRKSIPVLANFMKRLIVCPSSNSIKGLLPIAFRCRYSNVETILDCFEIGIQKPSNAIHQALTWSDYKKDNI